MVSYRDRPSSGPTSSPRLVVEHGIDSFVFGPAEDPVRQVQVFAAEVALAVREAVARHRHPPEPA